MSEIQQKHCKICGQLKTRILNGTFSNPKNKRWVDENGKQWNGHKCPDCQKSRTRANMQFLRNGRKLDAEKIK